MILQGSIDIGRNGNTLVQINARILKGTTAFPTISLSSLFIFPYHQDLVSLMTQSFEILGTL